MKNLKIIVLPLFFVFGIAIATTETQSSTESTPESTKIDKHLVTCGKSNCTNKVHPRNKEIKPFQITGE